MFTYSNAVNPRLKRHLDEYAMTHKNRVNVLIHWIFEPAAIWALLALFWNLPLPSSFATIPGINGMTLLEFILLVYFAHLSKPLALILTCVAVIFSATIAALASSTTFPILHAALPLFAISWIALFIGHRIEGNVPSVFKNPHLIFIGPVWLVSKLIPRQRG